jgi:hypothetical protein
MEENQPHWASTILYSLAWLICCLLIIVDILAIREASLDVLTSIQARRVANAARGEAGQERLETGFTIEAIDQGMLFFGGITAVALAIGLEYYFRIGKQKGKLVLRVGMTLGILVAIFVICIIVEQLV